MVKMAYFILCIFYHNKTYKKRERERELTFEVANIQARQNLEERHRPDVSVTDLLPIVHSIGWGPQRGGSTAQAGPLPSTSRDGQQAQTGTFVLGLWPAHGQKEACSKAYRWQRVGTDKLTKL